jgi:hypothetical protein
MTGENEFTAGFRRLLNEGTVRMKITTRIEEPTLKKFIQYSKAIQHLSIKTYTT